MNNTDKFCTSLIRYGLSSFATEKKHTVLNYYDHVEFFL